MKLKNNTCPACTQQVDPSEAMICKFCGRYLNAEAIKRNTRVIYSPTRSSMIRAITDNAYDLYGFYPGEILTVDGFEIDEGGMKYILVKENDSWFSPFELMPEKKQNKEIIKKLLEQYSELKAKYKR